MRKNFAALCQELGLTEGFSSEAVLTTLKNWCFNHISQDMRFDGSLEEQYLDYYVYAQKYVDFLAQKADLNDLSPIQYASDEGYHYFLSQHATAENINLPTPYQMTPLHLAATSGHIHTVDVLLEHGANPYALNNQGEPPIFSALFLPMLYQHNSVEQKKLIFKLLAFKAPETLNNVTQNGDNILHLIAANPVFNELIDLPIAKHPHLAFQSNHYGLYPIHLAILNHSFAAAQSLLKMKGMSDVKTSKRLYPIHLAARINHPEIIEICFKSNPCLINALDDTCKTPLLLASEVGNIAGVATLIQLGADPLVKDLHEMGIVDYAIKFNYLELQDWLIKHDYMLPISNQSS